MTPGLELKGIRVTYRRRGLSDLHAVDGVDLNVAPGEVVGLVGESGCGKSSLARVVCGLERLSAGSATFDDHPIIHLGLGRRSPLLQRVQMVFQNPNASLNPRRRIGRQIEDGRAINPAGPAHAPSVQKLLGDVGLAAMLAQRYPHELSGGQRQRVAIARVLASGPRLIVGDEPIASLDASLQVQVAALLRDVAVRYGAGLLFISHDLSIVRTIADRVCVMRDGRIVEQGPTEQLWSKPSNPYTRRLIAAIPVADGLGRLPEDSEA